MSYLGFDIGGSSVKAVLVKNQKIIRSQKFNLPQNFVRLCDLLKEIVDDFGAHEEIKGAGFSVVGPLDSKREKVLDTPNIPFLKDRPIKKMFAKKLGLPIKIEHDVHCFVLAEKKVGLAKNMKNVFYLTLGTGIGGALMIDGKIYTGSHGASGEIGQMIIRYEIEGSSLYSEEKPAEIKNPLDFESLASNKFIKSDLGVSSYEALDLMAIGDKKAERTFEKFGLNLGIGIANIINVIDPEAVILAGGLIKARKFVEPGIRIGIKKFVISRESQKTKVFWSRFGDFGGALGATFLFKDFA